MSNFWPGELNRLWLVLCDHLHSSWNVGRGKKCQHKAKGVLFMFLAALKHCGK
ncbi:hypothetical protein PybrP1_001306 [[Pythium] brassicae (nom. inval.)]|nr:hypothetical protein PybrP1_001306 [[Pythium] brassicae (nom. inval.)]